LTGRYARDIFAFVYPSRIGATQIHPLRSSLTGKGFFLIGVMEK
jgi:hypothetical protein